MTSPNTAACVATIQVIFFIIIQKLVTIDHKTSVPEFISCKLEGFFLSPFNDIFVGIFGNLMLLSTA